MLSLKLAPQAIVDLEEIYEYTYFNWGVRQAERYQDDLYDSMFKISKNDSLGVSYYFTKGNYRKLKVNRHLIFYRTTKEDCVIVRILHERMDLDMNLSKK